MGRYDVPEAYSIAGEIEIKGIELQEGCGSSAIVFHGWHFHWIHAILLS